MYYFPKTALTDLAVSKPSNDIFLAVKHLESDSLTSIPFLIRAYSEHTAWSRIVFTFLAEDKLDVEASYRQIDSSNLGTCLPTKSILTKLNYAPSFLAAKSSPYDSIQHKLFLSGF